MAYTTTAMQGRRAFNSHVGHQDLGSNGQVANAAGRLIGEGR